MLVTLCVDGRQALFGRLEGNIRAQRDTADFPHIVLSDLGRIVVEEELPKIHQFYPEIEVWKAAEICNTTDVVLLDLANLG